MLITLMLVLTLGVAHTLAFKKSIFPFTYIAEVEVSNLSAEEAASKVSRVISDENQGLWLTIEGQKIRLQPDNIGLSYKIQEAVSKAWDVGRGPSLFWNMWERIMTLIYKNRVNLEVNYDEELLGGWLAAVVNKTEAEAMEPNLTLVKGEIVFINGEDGKRVDLERLQAQVEDNLDKIQRTEIEVVVEVNKQRLSEDRAVEVMILAEELKERELIIKGEVEEELLWNKKLENENLIGLVGFDDKWQEEKLKEITEEAGAAMNRSPVNARFEKVGNKLVDFAPHKVGVEVDKQKIGELIIDALENGHKEVIVPYQSVDPEVKAGEINDLGIEELLGRGESNYFHSIPNRIHNVALATSRLDGILVAPDEVFSFNQVVGEISASTGYKTAWVISGGRTVLGDGGGVCQVSTTLFRALLNAGLPIVERRAHAYRVEYYEQGYPMGLDATVYSPSVDLKFKNDTGKWLLIQAEADSGNLHLIFDIYGTDDGRVANISSTKVFSTSSAPPPEYIDDPSLPVGKLKQVDFAAGGAKVAFDYVVTRGDETIINKAFYSNYQPWRAVFLRGTGN